MFMKQTSSPQRDEPLSLEGLPKLPGDWRFEGRKIVYDGPHVDDWAKTLTTIGDLIAKSR